MRVFYLTYREHLYLTQNNSPETLHKHLTHRRLFYGGLIISYPNGSVDILKISTFTSILESNRHVYPIAYVLIQVQQT